MAEGELATLRVDLCDTAHLRLLQESDAMELHALIEANREHLARWLPWAAAQTPEDTLAFIRRTREQLAGGRGFQMAIVCDGKIAGVIGYPDVDWQHRSTSVGYWLSEAQQGRGTMTVAVNRLVDHAFSVWKLNRVEVRAATENSRSRAIPERLGFRWEGTLRQAEQIGDHYLDIDVYSMLASDWAG
jgi:ribosomal-protein-serine acetyltransferase